MDVDGNGSIDLDLPGMGADPRHKDLFVELDFMPPHRFDAAAAALIADAFADAPVSNPDGSAGIALHLDNGSDSVMNPKTGATWGSRSRQSSLVHQDVLGAVAGGDYDWTAFDDAADGGVPAGAQDASFRYAISAHGHDGRVSGVARGIPASDLLVTLGAGCAFLNGGVDCTLDTDGPGGDADARARPHARAPPRRRRRPPEQAQPPVRHELLVPAHRAAGHVGQPLPGLLPLLDPARRARAGRERRASGSPPVPPADLLTRRALPGRHARRVADQGGAGRLRLRPRVRGAVAPTSTATG